MNCLNGLPLRTTGEAATAFLDLQGDEWNTQWDMFLALLWAVTSQIAFQANHDRQLANMQ
jgi:putative membrane protein